MATPSEIDAFLESSQRRAYKHALFACRDEAASLDIVQESMLSLVEKYSARPPSELGPLFQTILQNAITTHFRRSKTRSFWTPLLSSFYSKNEDEASDPVDFLPDFEECELAETPETETSRAQTRAILEEELALLPQRQRQAFILRHWDDMDVAQTAAAMGCSEGSVKTHCSRAAKALSIALSARGVSL